jgi:hypothetical protein
MRRSLASVGLNTPTSTTPAEFLALSSGLLAASDRLLVALNQATELYQQAEYSRREPSIIVVLDTHRAWQRAYIQWVLLWLTARWKRLTARHAASH